MRSFSCQLGDATAAEIYQSFRDSVCNGRSRRYAMLCNGSDGLRCKLENSGRCLDPDTSWEMVQRVVAPMFRFDAGMEWVALLPVDDWKKISDDAVAESLRCSRPWPAVLAETLARRMEGAARLMIAR